MTVTISQLISYPIKSCAGVQHQATELTAMGLRGDRQLMLVDKDGLFISQRKYPQLARIQASPTAQGLTVNAPGMEPLTVDLPTSNQPHLKVTIWKNSLSAESFESVTNQWFSTYLKTAVKLVKYGRQSHRPIDPDFAQFGETVAFADGYPLLIAHEASLKQLNQHLSNPIGMDRFRPNIVVSSEAAPWDELNWLALSAAQFKIDLVKPCTRCVMTGVEQSTGQQTGSEVLMTLKQKFAHQDQAVFGINGIARITESVGLSVGQTLHAR